jgi:hypothetical protein
MERQARDLNVISWRRHPDDHRSRACAVATSTPAERGRSTRSRNLQPPCPLYPAVSIEVWGLKTLANEICKLRQEQIDKIIDITSTEEPQPIRIVPEPAPFVRLSQMKTGRDLWPILSDSLAWIIDEPDGCTEGEEDLIDGALQTLTDWLEISSDVEGSRSGVRDAQRNITSILDELRTEGFDLYSGIRQDIVTGGTAPPAPFRAAIFRVVRMTGEPPSSTGT